MIIVCTFMALQPREEPALATEAADSEASGGLLFDGSEETTMLPEAAGGNVTEGSIIGGGQEVSGRGCPLAKGQP